MKLGMGGTGTGGTTGKTGNRALIWLAWLLSTAGFGILLGGVASLQQACGDNPTFNTVNVGYLGPVSCDHYLQYTWWITFLHFFTWFLVLVYLAAGVLHKSRIALVGILSVAAVLLMDTANSFLMYNYILGLSGKLASRARVTVAGAIVAAVADLLLILLIGWDADRDRVHDTIAAVGASAVPAAGAVPMHGTTTSTTYTTAGTAQVPVSTV